MIHLCALWTPELFKYLLRIFRQKLGDNRMKRISEERTVVEERTAAGYRPLNVSKGGGHPEEGEAVRGPRSTFASS